MRTTSLKSKAPSIAVAMTDAVPRRVNAIHSMVSPLESFYNDKSVFSMEDVRFVNQFSRIKYELPLYRKNGFEGFSADDEIIKACDEIHEAILYPTV
jgi:hypothetical protein